MNFKKNSISIVLIIGLVIPWTATSACAFFARLTLDSEPGDPIGQGGMFDISYDASLGDRVSAQIRRRLPDGRPAELAWVLDRRSTSENEFALVFFGTDALGIPIQPGIYPEARRADFAPVGFAGLDVSFQNRGLNQVFGSFTIFDVSFSDDQTEILTFDAEFLQRASENPTFPALRGRFQFNKSPIQEVPEPLSVLGTIIVMGIGITMKCKQSLTVK